LNLEVGRAKNLYDFFVRTTDYPKQPSMLIKKLGLIAMLASFLINNLTAATLTNYAVGDVLICFRPANPATGVSLGGTNLVVDAGPISYFTNLAPNTKVTIPGVSGTQLSQTGTNKVGWSAFAYFDDSIPPTVPNTIFITSPRSSLNAQTTPHNCGTSSQNNNTIGQMAEVPAGAANNINFSGLNTSNAVLELDTYNFGANAESYYNAVGSTLDFNQTFTYNFEQYTPASFTFNSNPQRSDFYWMYPAPLHATAPAIFLGYFEFATNGVMTYTAYPSATPVTPVIVSFSRSGTTNFITFSTWPTGTYTLRGTNSAGLTAARTSWPSLASTGGTGSNVTIQDVSSSSNLFYLISAQ
jgi:hypothetical protein